MKTIEEKIISRIYGLGRGVVVTPSDFLDIAAPDAVRQALGRLVKERKIRRLLRGVYEYPAWSRILNAVVPADPDAIARAVARSHGWTIVPTGETALNRLGLSTQVPAQWQYVSDGPTKTYSWEGRTLVLKHRTIKEVSSLSPKTALVVQALKSLGKDRLEDSHVLGIRSKLNERERAHALREARHVTAWVYEVIKRVSGKKDSRA